MTDKTYEGFLDHLSREPDEATRLIFGDFLREQNLFSHDFLLKLVKERRGEDWPRFLFADWLEENGQAEKGDTIRAMLGKFIPAMDFLVTNNYSGHYLIWTGNSGHHESSRVDIDAVRRLLVGSDKYCDSYPPGFLPGMAFRVNRGFIELVGCTISAWRTSGPALVASHPISQVMVGRVRHVDSGDAFASWEITATEFDWLNPFIKWKWCKTQAAAEGELSRALIAWAKAEAMVP